ncbi:hypothetical protein BofuT4_uP149810.1 [Botrytis cinerea T4]|uniref:Uncharacterized protein n=1 Tax=Botryotinia fuckeliana (strain T4) TaxID=999810 RepID=G2YXD3_BOTF4|nr:hypothetical protein BofuT4_uP149810.1 [Botrytis cinerea T4]
MNQRIKSGSPFKPNLKISYEKAGKARSRIFTFVLRGVSEFDDESSWYLRWHVRGVFGLL